MERSLEKKRRVCSVEESYRSISRSIIVVIKTWSESEDMSREDEDEEDDDEDRLLFETGSWSNLSMASGSLLFPLFDS